MLCESQESLVWVGPARSLILTIYGSLWLAFKEYTKAIDMWSVGCILAEMSKWEEGYRVGLFALLTCSYIHSVNGRPLFPGRDYHHRELFRIPSLSGL